MITPRRMKPRQHRTAQEAAEITQRTVAVIDKHLNSLSALAWDQASPAGYHAGGWLAYARDHLHMAAHALEDGALDPYTRRRDRFAYRLWHTIPLLKDFVAHLTERDVRAVTAEDADQAVCLLNEAIARIEAAVRVLERPESNQVASDTQSP